MNGEPQTTIPQVSIGGLRKRTSFSLHLRTLNTFIPLSPANVGSLPHWQDNLTPNSTTTQSPFIYHTRTISSLHRCKKFTTAWPERRLNHGFSTIGQDPQSLPMHGLNDQHSKNSFKR